MQQTSEQKTVWRQTTCNGTIRQLYRRPKNVSLRVTGCAAAVAMALRPNNQAYSRRSLNNERASIPRWASFGRDFVSICAVLSAIFRCQACGDELRRKALDVDVGRFTDEASDELHESHWNTHSHPPTLLTPVTSLSAPQWLSQSATHQTTQ